ncbi:MAG: hypothetical protein ACRCUS_07110, partial [Anaerovoracaceae bacterium]
DAIFADIDSLSEGQQTQKVNKFYTFNRKNEEFQKLLDMEYEKFKKDTEDANTPFSQYVADKKFDTSREFEGVLSAEHIEEMAKARESFFTETLVQPELENVGGDIKEATTQNLLGQTSMDVEAPNITESTQVSQTSPAAIRDSAKGVESKQKKPAKGKSGKEGKGIKVVITILAILILSLLILIAIALVAPDSAVALFVEDLVAKVMNSLPGQ